MYFIGCLPIEYDLYNNSAAWSDYTPIAIKNRYKYRETDMDKYLFPDVDWGETMTKNVAWNHKANVSVSGGTDITKYFTSISYQHEGDLLKTKDLGYGYDPSFSYNRINIRSNFDIDLTKSTIFSVNLNSIAGFQKTPNSSELGNILRRIYNCPSYLYPLMYSNGNFGFNPTVGVNNPYRELNSTGVKRMNTYQINGDFKLNQKLDFITKGLELSGRFSLDTRIYSTGKSVKDSEKTSEYIYVDKYLEGNIDNAIIYSPVNGNSYYDYDGGPITYYNEVASKQVKRNYDYQVALKYNRSFGKHKVNGLGVFRRTKKAYGNVLPTLQEDWVGRLGYNYNDLYLLEVNGAYNGTDKFGPGYKFGFFPSIAGGWVVSNADFFHLDWINYLKLRASVGQVGSDAGASRFAYMDMWTAVDNKLKNGYTTIAERTPYPSYDQTVIGNSDIKWEVSTKQNYGLDSKFLDNKFNLGVEYWRDHRTDIFMSGFSRSVPSYFGANPVSANIGETKASGIELSLKYSDKTSWGLNYYTKVSYTQSRNKVVYAEDPELYDDYKKKEGHKIGQIYSFLDNGYINNYDDMYASLTEDGKNMAIGNLNMIDFNCDGKVDSKDGVPCDYTGSPENTLSFTLGGSYKGFSAFVMFYGVSNISQKVNSFAEFGGQSGDVVYDIVSDYWTPNNINAKYPIPTIGDQHSYGTKTVVDGSYLRLKSTQVAYTFKGDYIKNLGLSALKLYVNGNNLFFWSDLPADQEKGTISTVYPNSCVVNFGFNLTF